MCPPLTSQLRRHANLKPRRWQYKPRCGLYGGSGKLAQLQRQAAAGCRSLPLLCDVRDPQWPAGGRPFGTRPAALELRSVQKNKQVQHPGCTRSGRPASLSRGSHPARKSRQGPALLGGSAHSRQGRQSLLGGSARSRQGRPCWTAGKNSLGRERGARAAMALALVSSREGEGGWGLLAQEQLVHRDACTSAVQASSCLRMMCSQIWRRWAAGRGGMGPTMRGSQ